VIWHVPGTNRFSGRFDGLEAVLGRFRRMTEAGLDTVLHVHDVVANDAHAVALVRLRVTNAEGQRYDQQQVQVWHMADGRCHEYWSMNQDQAVLDLLLG
jgi:ketosteroid isomerase-like protein